MEKLTDAERQEALAMLSLGVSRYTAARGIGWSPVSFQAAILGDEELRRAVEQAEEAAELYLVGKLRTASDDPRVWRAAAWLLERRYPMRYGKSVPITEKNLRKLLGEVFAIIASVVDDEAKLAEITQRVDARIEALIAEDAVK